VIGEVWLTIVSGAVIVGISIIGVIGDVIVIGGIIIVISISCHWCCSVVVWGSVGGRVGLVMGIVAVRVTRGSMCRVCAAIDITVVVWCVVVVAAEQCSISCIDIDGLVGSIVDESRVSLTTCARADGSGGDVHADISGSSPRYRLSGLRASVLHWTCFLM